MKLFREYDHFATIDTASAVEVGQYLRECLLEIFPSAKKEADNVVLASNTLNRLFCGEFPRFQACDTPYHNLEHTLQVSVCLLRMIQGAVMARELAFEVTDLMNVLLASFCHDIGYFKQAGDITGTGAKYSAYHEARGALLASEYLAAQGFGWERIQAIQRYILSTGTHRALRYIEFSNEKEKLLAQMLVTADILAQVSDPHYFDRLQNLFLELEESDNYMGIPISERRYSDVQALEKGTPQFWEEMHKNCLQEDCRSVYRYLARPFPNGVNLYLQSIRK